MKEIRTLSGRQPHPSHGGWANFLKTCELRGTVDNVRHYGKVNCNYILFPDGTLIENFGYHGTALMSHIRHQGADKVLNQIKKNHQDMRELLCAP